MNRPKNIPLFALLTIVTLLAGGMASYALLAWSADLAPDRVDQVGPAG